jgi:tight adherence protein B
VTYQLAHPGSRSLWPIINLGLLTALGFLLLWLLTGNLIGGLFLAAAALGAAYWRLVQVPAEKRLDQIRLQLPDALTTMGNVLRSGATILPAVEQTAKETDPPLKGELEQVVADVSIGQDLQSALSAMRARVPLDELDNLTAALLIQQRSGGDLPELLSSMAALLRDSVRLKNELRIQTQEGRQTGLVIGLIPVVALGLLFVTNREYLDPLLTTGLGRLVLFLSMGMLFGGLLAIRRIVNVKV